MGHVQQLGPGHSLIGWSQPSYRHFTGGETEVPEASEDLLSFSHQSESSRAGLRGWALPGSSAPPGRPRPPHLPLVRTPPIVPPLPAGKPCNLASSPCPGLGDPPLPKLNKLYALCAAHRLRRPLREGRWTCHFRRICCVLGAAYSVVTTTLGDSLSLQPSELKSRKWTPS